MSKTRKKKKPPDVRRTAAVTTQCGVPLAKADDLRAYAKVEDLSAYAKVEDLSAFAKEEELADVKKKLRGLRKRCGHMDTAIAGIQTQVEDNEMVSALRDGMIFVVGIVVFLLMFWYFGK